MRRFIVMAVLVLAPSVASAQQSVSFSIGGFVPSSEGARSKDDVLRKNLDFLAFDIKDFNGATFGGEWLVGLGNNFEAGLGAGFYQRSVPSVYANFVNSTGAEIEQTIKLRIVPFTATVRVLPLGRHSGVEPYLGAGVGVLSWRYSESGEWLDSKNAIFRETYTGSGSATAPVILGGVRLPIGSGAVGGEIRYQSGEATLPTNQGFSAPKINLGGMTYSLTVQFKF